MIQKKDTVELTIGYHQLEGQSVALKKPLAMLEKLDKPDGTDSQALGYQVISSKLESRLVKSFELHNFDRPFCL